MYCTVTNFCTLSFFFSSMECGREAKCSPAGRTINFYISNSVVNITTNGQTKFSDQHRTENVNESTDCEVFQSSKRTAFGGGGSDGRNQGQQHPPYVRSCFLLFKLYRYFNIWALVLKTRSCK